MTPRQKEIRRRLLENQTIKVVAMELEIPTASVHRAIPLIGIRRAWLTDDEWKTLQQNRKNLA